MTMTKITTRLKKAVDWGTELRIGGNYITNGHWIVHRGELIRQGLKLSEPAQDPIVLRTLGFKIWDDELTEKMIEQVLPDNDNGIEYVRTSWLCEVAADERDRLQVCRLLRERVGGGVDDEGDKYEPSWGERWCLVRESFLDLIGHTTLRCAVEGKHAGTVLVSGREFGVMPVRVDSIDELSGLRAIV